MLWFSIGGYHLSNYVFFFFFALSCISVLQFCFTFRQKMVGNSADFKWKTCNIPTAIYCNAVKICVIHALFHHFQKSITCRQYVPFKLWKLSRLRNKYIYFE